jgi:hypothetical protein
MDWFSLKLKLEDFTLGFRPTVHVRIWQEAGKKLSEQAAELEPELELVVS